MDKLRVLAANAWLKETQMSSLALKKSLFEKMNFNLRIKP